MTRRFHAFPSILPLVFAAASLLATSSLVADCSLDSFVSLNLPATLFTTAQPQSTPAPHCEVVGRINPRIGTDGRPYSIGFHLRLPDQWNGRLYFQGGGGSDGNLGDALGSGALANGYAVVSTDAGHDNTINNDPAAGGTSSFGRDPQARIDYGYNAIDRVTVAAKQVIGAYFGRGPAYSYFVGCSNGGRQGMVLSQRFPSYFDGIVAGAPGFNLPKAAVAGAWNAQALAPLATRVSVQGYPYLPDTFSMTDLIVASNAILAACDALDGVVDGIVSNSPACTSALVYPQLDAIRCTSGKTPSCLTAAQIDALKKIQAGPTNSRGEALYSDIPWDGGLWGFMALRMWSLGNPAAPGQPLANNSANLTLGGGALPLVFTTPPAVLPTTALEGFTFNYNFDTDAPKIDSTSGIYTESAMDFMSAASSDLSLFRNRGGKMILYHGTSDGVFSSRDTMRWYESLFTADPTAGEYARLFLVPGMGHCAMGPGPTSFNALGELVKWVERGVEPESILATAPGGPYPVGTPWPGRTRPLCPHPGYARYTGSGDVNKAENFVCAFPAAGRVEPETLQRNDGMFVAVVTVPDLYKGKSWTVISAVCNGAGAKRTIIAGNARAIVAHFDRKDLNVQAGDAVPLNVTITIDYAGRQIVFQTAATVRVE